MNYPKSFCLSLGFIQDSQVSDSVVLTLQVTLVLAIQTFILNILFGQIRDVVLVQTTQIMYGQCHFYLKKVKR